GPRAAAVRGVGTGMSLPLSAWGTDDKLKIIRVDIDPTEFIRMPVPATGLAGDAAAILRRLDQHLAKRMPMDKARIAASRAVKEQVAAGVGKLGVIRDHLVAVPRDVPPDARLVGHVAQAVSP